MAESAVLILIDLCELCYSLYRHWTAGIEDDFGPRRRPDASRQTRCLGTPGR